VTIHHPNALIPMAAAALPAGLLALDIERAAGFAQAEKADATKRVYGSDFALFRSWCAGRGVNALPATPESVAAFGVRGRTWHPALDHRPPRCGDSLCP
jgi:hypothetical protein